MLYNAGLCPGGEADRKGRTAQHYAAENKYEGVVKMLIRNRARFNVRTVCPREDNYTLLHLAAIGGHEKVTQFLLDVGADANGTDATTQSNRYKGQPWAKSDDSVDPTPLHLAAKHGHEAIVKQLLGKEVNVGSLYSSETPLYLAAENGHEAVVKLLVEKGVNVGLSAETVSDHDTALHIAARNGHKAVIQVLLDNGADTKKLIYLRNGSRTAQHETARQGHKVVAQ